MRHARLLLGLACLLGILLPARAQFPPKDLLVPSLVADTSAVTAGQPFTVGFLLKIKPGWHTYWAFPGDAGAALNVKWDLPAGYQAGPLQYPLPTSRLEEGDLLAYLYEGEVLITAQITPPASLPPGGQSLKAKLGWLVCEKSCIPGRGNVELTIPAGDAPTTANAELFAKWRAQMPKTGAPFSVKWDTTNPQELHLIIAGIDADQKVEFFPLPPPGYIPGHPKISDPAADGTRTVTIPLPEKTAGPWRGLIVAQKGTEPRAGWLVSSTDKPVETAAASAPTSTAPVGTTIPFSASTSPPPPAQVQKLGAVLILAFLGGLLLNIMPCVLPVIALKIFGFIHQAGHDPKRISRLGLAFIAGVFVFFLGLATAVSILGSAFHWGFQFQNPHVLVALISLVFVFGLNLLGVFEITLASNASSALSDLSSKAGYQGAFLHGLFTTLLGTSCTAPLLGPALGYATTQSAPIVFLLFITIAAGLSLPYFLLTSQPRWMKYLPKPGVWMERFKQAMGFVMLAVAIWLFTVFAGRGAEATEALAWFLFILGLAAWLFGIISQRLVAAAAALFLIIGGYFGILRGNLEANSNVNQTAAVTQGGIAWKPLSTQTLETALKDGKPVFIDFTADWCINCKFFERTVLNSDSVSTALKQKNVLTLRGDWTNQDPAVTKYLTQFGRVGVPLYVLYRPGESQPIIQDGLTRSSLLGELAKLDSRPSK